MNWLGQPLWVDKWIGRVLTGTAMIAVAYVALWLSYSVGDEQWPYTVLERKLLTPKVERGGQIVMRRVIDYSYADFWRQYDRRIVNRNLPAVPHRFAPQVEQRLPVDLSGLAQDWKGTVPKDFPCGPAYLVETVTGAGTLFQRVVRPLRKPDIITSFEVVGCGEH